MSLELLSVTRRFGRQAALDDVTLRVRRGDCYGFLGHNGAGKTTAMRILLGLSRPDAGRVIVDGFDALEHPREARARLGGLIEVPSFHGTWNGRRNLYALARLQGMNRREALDECDRVLELVGLGDVGRKRVRAYSQGMRQRLGIAQALLGNPAYVLLDEPTNGLDPEGIAELRGMIARLREEGTTVLVSSHQLAEIAEMSNRVGVIKKGRMVLEAPIEALVGSGDDAYGVVAADAAAAAAALQGAGVDARLERDELIVQLGHRRPDDVVSILLESGCGLRAFAPLKPSLEDVYLRCGASDAAAPAPSPVDDAHAKAGPPEKREAPPFPIWRAFAYDVRRWTGHKVAWLLAAPALLAVAGVHGRLTDLAADTDDLNSGELASTTNVTAFEALGWGLKAGLPLLTFLAVGLASQAIAGELSQGTLRNVLLRPVDRTQVAIGKACSTLAAVLLGYLLVFAASYVAAEYWFDFTDVTETLINGEPYVYVTAEQLWEREFWPLTWAPLLPLAAYAAIGFFIGAISRRATAALVGTLLVAAFLDVGRALARSYRVEEWLPSAYLPSPLGDTSYVAYYIDASTGAANAAFAYEATAYSHPGSIAAALFVVAAFALTRRTVS